MACNGCRTEIRGLAPDSSAMGFALVPGPAFVENPITHKFDLPKLPYLLQIMIDGTRVGYVNTKPGAAIMLLKFWPEQQKEAIVQAVLEELALHGKNIDRPRRVTMPRSPDGLVREESDDEAETVNSTQLVME